MSEDLKTFKAPKVEVTVSKQYEISIAGKSLGTFTEAGELCGMKQLNGESGTVVIDCPSHFEEILATLFSGDSEPFKASVMKASPDIIHAMQKAIEDARKQREQDAAGDVEASEDVERKPVTEPEGEQE